MESEQSAADAASREADIATSNPLLNLAAALGQQTPGLSTTAPGSFQVKKRWDDGQSQSTSSTSSKHTLMFLYYRPYFQKPGYGT